MSRWKTSFDDNKCHQRAKDALVAVEAANVEGLASADLAEYARLIKTLRIIEGKLTTLDPELLHLNIWGNVASWFNAVLSEVQAFAQDRNPGHFQNANNSLDEVVGVLRPTDASGSAGDVSAIRGAAETFNQKIVAELDSTRKRAEETRGKLDSIVNEVQQVQQNVQSSGQAIEQQKGRLDEAIAEFQRQFSQSEANRATEFASTIQRIQSDLAAQQKAVQEDYNTTKQVRDSTFDAFMKGTDSKVIEYIKHLETRKAQVDEIFGAIGSGSLAGHFAKTADQDARDADRLRNFALAFMVAMIAVAGYSFYESLKHPDINWLVFLFRLGTAIIILIPAVYVAQESAKHRERERQNRRIQIELATIDSYLVALPEPKRNELKEKLTDKFFGRELQAGKDEPVSQHALFELISEAVKNLTKAK